MMQLSCPVQRTCLVILDCWRDFTTTKYWPMRMSEAWPLLEDELGFNRADIQYCWLHWPEHGSLPQYKQLKTRVATLERVETAKLIFIVGGNAHALLESMTYGHATIVVDKMRERIYQNKSVLVTYSAGTSVMGEWVNHTVDKQSSLELSVFLLTCVKNGS